MSNTSVMCSWSGGAGAAFAAIVLAGCGSSGDGSRSRSAARTPAVDPVQRPRDVQAPAPPRQRQRPSAAHAVQHLAAAGPALAGGTVCWGEGYRDGSLAVVRRRPGGAATTLHRIAAPTGRNRRTGFSGLHGALSASRRWVVYGLDVSTVAADGDHVGIVCSTRAFGSRDGGPFRDLLPRCGAASTVSSASEGDAVAIGQADATCNRRPATRVWLIEGATRPRLIYESAEAYVALRQVRMAGPWIAWSAGGSGAGDASITVARRKTGKVVARWTTKDFEGGRGFTGFDIDADGNVVALSGPQPRCLIACVTVRRIGTARRRSISRRASDASPPSVAGGRIAYVSSPRRGRGQIVIAGLDGSVQRRLDRFDGARRPLRDLVLDGERIAWAVLRSAGDAVPGAPGSIRTARLP